VPEAPTDLAYWTQRRSTAAEAMLARAFDPSMAALAARRNFPIRPTSAFLLRRDNAAAREMALTTLRRMCEGGIYDQIGGGFCRYSVDERWEIPALRKNALRQRPAAGALRRRLGAEPASRTVRPRREETAAWVLREMQAPEGGYFSRWMPIPKARKASTTSGIATTC
jgi:uncharacterized protein YyaL (SSP411 family)